jgi:hypothetical protein
MIHPYVHDELLYAHKPSMVWNRSLLEFVLNCLVEMVSFTHGLKEGKMKKVACNVLDFTGKVWD